MPYLMESPREADRLILKSDADTSRQQLELTGLKAGMVAVDAGGGAGFVSKIMSEIVGKDGRVILVDQSEDRLKHAEEYVSAKNMIYRQSPLEKIRLEDESVDYIFCRFVFEYLNDPNVVLKEFLRVAKPGAKIVVGDLDYNCLNHYPLKPSTEAQLHQVISELQRLKYFDPYIGRKLYTMFYRSQLNDIKVHILPHHLIYGESNTRDFENWKQKIEMIEQLAEENVIKLDFDIREFKNEFLKFFKDPERFSYTPLILVEAVK